jgi:hypothetical protein
LAIFGWLQAREAGRSVPPEQDKLVIDTLAAVVAGNDPRKIFGWPPPGRKPADKRRTKNIWREQLMAAETLRLVRQEHATDEARASEIVADAFDVEAKTVMRALDEWRNDLESGDLDRYLKTRAPLRALTNYLAHLKTRD